MSQLRKPLSLVHCRDCGSPLLQPVQVAGPIKGESLVTRSCPDCGRCDIVTATDAAVQIWLRRDARTTLWMLASADFLAATLDRVEPALSPDAVS